MTNLKYLICLVIAPLLNSIIFRGDNQETDGIDEEVDKDSDEKSAKKKHARKGRKAQWLDNHVADMVDVIWSDDHFARKLIFINSKKTGNNEVHCKVQKEVKKRYTGSSAFPTLKDFVLYLPPPYWIILSFYNSFRWPA